MFVSCFFGLLRVLFVFVVAVSCLLAQTRDKRLIDEKYKPIDPKYDWIFDPQLLWTREQRTAFFNALLTRSPLVGSSSWKDVENRPTFGRYFKLPEYQLLQGNDAMGWTYEGGFIWRPEWKDVWFEPFLPVLPGTHIVKPAAWEKAAKFVCERHGLRLNRDAKIRIEGRTIDIQHVPMAGLLVEAKFISPTGTFLYRGSLGKKTFADLVIAFTDYLVLLARGNDGTVPTFEEWKAFMEENFKMEFYEHDPHTITKESVSEQFSKAQKEGKKEEEKAKSSSGKSSGSSAVGRTGGIR